ncbi:hypothetical protein FORC066_3330 [Yersinia enterocolitica]|nr:hypothetical protein FORC066_3330 [Yersinia enterocolitica]
MPVNLLGNVSKQRPHFVILWKASFGFLDDDFFGGFEIERCVSDGCYCVVSDAFV